MRQSELGSTLRLFPAIFLFVFIAEASLAVAEIDLAPVDVGGLDIRREIERVATGYDEGGGFSWFQGAQLIVDTEELRRIESDGFQSVFFWQAKGGSHRRLVREIAFVRRFGVAAIHRQAETHAGLVQFGGVTEGVVITVIAPGWERGGERDDNGRIGFL